MAIKKVGGVIDTPAMELTLDGSTAVTIDSLLYRDTTNGVVKEATGSAGKSIDLIAVSQGPEASGAVTVDAVPLIQSPTQLWEVDCTNNTAANQLLKAQAMTDARTVANTSSHIATTLGVFVPTALVGVAADKKLRGYFLLPGQVVS